MKTLSKDFSLYCTDSGLVLSQVSVANHMGIPYQKHRGSSLEGVHLHATAKRQDNIRVKSAPSTSFNLRLCPLDDCLSSLSPCMCTTGACEALHGNNPHNMPTVHRTVLFIDRYVCVYHSMLAPCGTSVTEWSDLAVACPALGVPNDTYCVAAVWSEL